MDNKNEVNKDKSSIKSFKEEFDEISTRYIKISARNIKTCPANHPGEGGKAWLFVDEIIVE